MSRRRVQIAIVACVAGCGAVAGVLAQQAPAGAPAATPGSYRFAAADLPEPSASVANPAKLVPKPEGASLTVPDGFTVALFAQGFKRPRWVEQAPDGAIFVSDSTVGAVYRLAGRQRQPHDRGQRAHRVRLGAQAALRHGLPPRRLLRREHRRHRPLPVRARRGQGERGAAEGRRPAERAGGTLDAQPQGLAGSAVALRDRRVVVERGRRSRSAAGHRDAREAERHGPRGPRDRRAQSGRARLPSADQAGVGGGAGARRSRRRAGSRLRGACAPGRLLRLALCLHRHARGAAPQGRAPGPREDHRPCPRSCCSLIPR